VLALKYTIIELIKCAQSEFKSCETIWLQLIDIFRPRIYFYLNRLKNYEFYGDFIADLMIVIKKIPIYSMRIVDERAIYSYIYKAIYNSYIAISKRNSKWRNETCCDNIVEISDAVVDNTDVLLVSDELSVIDILSDSRCQLSDLEKNVLYLHFGSNHSIVEIADKLHISRQAVNKAKNRGLSKLKAMYAQDKISTGR
jgi:RNA polymerase sigma factor (sigma-70 family)